jgi:O-antigen ligase
VFWLFGAGAIVWPLLAVPMAARLLQRGRVVRVPRGFGWWLLFLVWMCLSFIALSGELPLAFMWRAASYFSATVTFIYVYNTPRERLPSARVVSLLAGFWIVTVAGGWLGVILPNGQITTPVERLLPTSLVSHEFVRILVHPIFAQVQEVLGYPLGRPTAPFLYTNDWGGVYALTIPFFILGWLQSGRAARRTMALLLLAASLVPALLSLNRGLWVSLLIALLFGASRSGDVGRLARRSLVAIVLVGLALIAFTPLKSVVEGRAEHQHSNEGREFLYVETVKAVTKSPIIGYGGPLPYGGPKIIPNMGTQGQFWLVLFSQGVPGAFFFVAFLVKMTRATRRGPVVTFWCHVTLTIALVQIFVYDMIPVQLHLIMVVAALGCREAQADRPAWAAT